MREIKFRAWWANEKTMLNNVHDFYDTLGNIGHGNEYEPENSFSGVLDNPDEYQVMQYTGLKDKNGVEIYEGDILQFGDGICREVSYDHEHTGFKLKGEDPVNPLWQMHKSMQVIGNIYENKELLNENR